MLTYEQIGPDPWSLMNQRNLLVPASAAASFPGSYSWKITATAVKTSAVVKLSFNLIFKYFSHFSREVSKVFQKLSKRLLSPICIPLPLVLSEVVFELNPQIHLSTSQYHMPLQNYTAQAISFYLWFNWRTRMDPGLAKRIEKLNKSKMQYRCD